ncbi:MAG TPA: zinc finger domain-containing protein, partial [Spirochaetota bacterium]|nr:zinc finger domain-containing protein [Spirochaetota bacterium]HOK93735.1 zinc finger domain-containing protein [Spirochaetota bacterium]
KALEDLRRDKIIKSSLEADVTIYPKDNSLKEIMLSMGDDLRRFLQVAKVIYADNSNNLKEYDHCFIKAQKSSGLKCVRCWNFFDRLGSDPQHPELCDRCTAVIKSMEG